MPHRSAPIVAIDHLPLPAGYDVVPCRGANGADAPVAAAPDRPVPFAPHRGSGRPTAAGPGRSAVGALACTGSQSIPAAPTAPTTGRPQLDEDFPPVQVGPDSSQPGPTLRSFTTIPR